MNKTLKRSLSGTVYVAIMWFGTSYYQESFHALFLILGIICLYEMWKLRKGKSIFTSSEIIPYLYVITPFTLVHFISPVSMLFLFILTWTFDTFAYLIGSKFGKHKILPSVSPKKSWEGFVGGFIFTIIISYFTYKHFDFLKFPLIISIILPFTATIGDFIESYYKRKAGVKDSGNFIPGHGGMLDRMDAFMISIPIFYIFTKLI
jgi:phosphatidate cytidylyltransferase